MGSLSLKLTWNCCNRVSINNVGRIQANLHNTGTVVESQQNEVKSEQAKSDKILL